MKMTRWWRSYIHARIFLAFALVTMTSLSAFTAAEVLM